MNLYNGVLFPCDGPDLANVEKIDMGAMPMTIAMMTRGMQVDLSHFEIMAKTLTDDMDRVTEEVYTLTGYRVNLGSGDQVSDLLHKKLGIKQPKMKFTPSGDRESVDYEALVAIQHEHVVVANILHYKELEKLRGTYVVPMPKLACRTGHGVWRMFPNLGTTRVPSGRYNCIAKGSLVEIARDVSKFPKGVPIEQIKRGDLAYTYDQNLNLTLRKVKWCQKTAVDKAVIRIHWKGQGNKHSGHLDLTSNHRVRLTDGSYTPAGRLKPGDRILSLSRGTTNGYARLWATGIGEIEREHCFIWECLHGPIPKEQDVHHDNGNKLDNQPDNLNALHRGEHHRLHGKAKVFTPEYRDKLRTAAILRDSTAHMRGHNTLNLTKEWIETELEKFQGKPTQVCKAHRIDYETFQKYLQLHKIDWKPIAKRHKLQNNHEVLRVEKLKEKVDVYDLGIEDTQNFIVGELCVHNCKEPNLLAFPTRTQRGRQIREGFITDPGWCYLSVDFSQFEPRACAHYSGDPGLITVFQTGQDLYSDFATSAFQLTDQRYEDGTGWHYPGIDKEEHRFPSKTCFLAAIYDVTAMGLQEQMPVICAHCLKPAAADKDEIAIHDCDAFSPLWTEDKCQEILNALYIKYPGILTDRRAHHARARRYGYIWDLWGRLHHVAAVRSVHPWVVSAALRETGNFPYQGLNSGALKLSQAAIMDDLVEAGAYGDVWYPLLPVHDEIVSEVRIDYAQEVAELMKFRFEECVPLAVPVKAEYKTGPDVLTWGRAK